MRSRLKWIVPLLILIAAVVGFYLWPVPRAGFDQVYARVEPATLASLKAFRQAYPPQHLTVDGITWEYIVAGQGEEAILFLHGMTGAYDIWWQQIEALKDQYRLVSVTYPAAQSLGDLERGLLAILEKERIEKFNVVGTSLGGYLAQFLVTKHPERILAAVFANTFPPNDEIARQYRLVGAILPYAPEWLVMSVLRTSFRQMIYPASGNDELTLAFLNEIGYGRMNKAQVVGRYRCVIEKFTVATPALPLMIIESDNDPLINPTLREQLKATYPRAVVHTFSNAGHFPYLNRPDEYSRLLAEFFASH